MIDRHDIEIAPNFKASTLKTTLKLISISDDQTIISNNEVLVAELYDGGSINYIKGF